MKADAGDFRSTVIKTDKIGLSKLRIVVGEEDVKIIRPPATGLVMMGVKDSCNSVFYLGEVFVTEAEVEYKGYKGYGILVGDESEKAYILAAIDAILQSGEREIRERISKIITSQQKRIKRKTQQEESLIAKTTVSFELMSAG
jgi:alpha-D-ribose 1-methylphosphonate 5-triphosphate synthase subunit PhnG